MPLTREERREELERLSKEKGFLFLKELGAKHGLTHLSLVEGRREGSIEKILDAEFPEEEKGDEAEPPKKASKEEMKVPRKPMKEKEEDGEEEEKAPKKASKEKEPDTVDILLDRIDALDVASSNTKESLDNIESLLLYLKEKIEVLTSALLGEQEPDPEPEKTVTKKAPKVEVGREEEPKKDEPKKKPGPKPRKPLDEDGAD